MRETRSIMGMPITIEVVADDASAIIESTFAYFHDIDECFSTYKDTSEISKINRNEISEIDYSPDMREVFEIAARTKAQTDGYFDMRRPDGTIDPSGIVKGWAINNAARQLKDARCENFFVEAGGDIAMRGKSSNGQDWSVGIRNPFNATEIIKVIYPQGHGVATSGSYIRGAHIYNPHDASHILDTVVSITVIGPDVLEADRFATAAFAMQSDGIRFIERTDGLEGYMVDKDGTATMTSGFERFTSV
jgi:thiamine biosynthesis lipoprotein